MRLGRCISLVDNYIHRYLRILSLKTHQNYRGHVIMVLSVHVIKPQRSNNGGKRQEAEKEDTQAEDGRLTEDA